jgi:hypothetical protein
MLRDPALHDGARMSPHAILYPLLLAMQVTRLVALLRAE